MSELIEMAYCCGCMSVQKCTVERSVGVTTWRCKACESVVDQDWDDDEPNWLDQSPTCELLESAK